MKSLLVRTMLWNNCSFIFYFPGAGDFEKATYFFKKMITSTRIRLYKLTLITYYPLYLSIDKAQKISNVYQTLSPCIKASL